MPKKSSKTNQLDVMRHSCAHLLAQAVLELFPQTKLGIGPAISDGFYYDFDFKKALTSEDFPKIEKKMKEIIKRDLRFEKEIIDKDKAIKLFKKLKQPYKVELVSEIKDKKVTIYKQGNFVDLCSGPHLKSTSNVGSFKLLSQAGAYWKGSEENPMLTRIYGTCFKTEKNLKNHLDKLKELEKRDHRKLGKDLDLFTISDEAGAGLPLWHPKGALLRQIIENFITKEHLQNGYQLVNTPHIARLGLWKTSGHWDFYKELMYSPLEIEKSKYLLKPMSCPFHIKIFKSQMRSYRDLPIRWFEPATVYRFEKSGVLHGLLRVRGFTQDDAHIFLKEEQLKKEIDQILDFALKILADFGFEKYEIDLSIRDPKQKTKYLGKNTLWEKAEKALTSALDKRKLKYKKAQGEAVFYGPKIDLKIKDALGRPWQCTTIQIDFNLPERFDISYIGPDGKKHRPILIHRAILGSVERFIGCLLEHYKGALPFWLSPVQVQVIPVSEKHLKYAEEVAKKLKKENIRQEMDVREKSVSKKIRDLELKKVPYMIVVGSKEIKNKTVTIRQRDQKKLESLKIEKFLKKITKEIKERKVL